MPGTWAASRPRISEANPAPVAYIGAEDMDFGKVIEVLRAFRREEVRYVLMKKDTLRPIDRADAEALRRRFRLDEDP